MLEFPPWLAMSVGQLGLGFHPGDSTDNFSANLAREMRNWDLLGVD